MQCTSAMFCYALIFSMNMMILVITLITLSMSKICHISESEFQFVVLIARLSKQNHTDYL